MKKILMILVISSSFLLVGCGRYSSVQTNTPASATTEDWRNKDFGPYAGKEYPIKQTKDLYDFQVTLNKIII
jgi:outer membrane biogenesis lipoprotein LolB